MWIKIYSQYDSFYPIVIHRVLKVLSNLLIIDLKGLKGIINILTAPKKKIKNIYIYLFIWLMKGELR